MKADDLLACQDLWEVLLQDAPVLLLHDEYEIGPSDVPSVDPYPGAWFSPSRLYGIPWNTLEHVLGG